MPSGSLRYHLCMTINIVTDCRGICGLQGDSLNISYTDCTDTAVERAITQTHNGKTIFRTEFREEESTGQINPCNPPPQRQPNFIHNLSLLNSKKGRTLANLLELKKPCNTTETASHRSQDSNDTYLICHLSAHTVPP